MSDFLKDSKREFEARIDEEKNPKQEFRERPKMPDFKTRLASLKAGFGAIKPGPVSVPSNEIVPAETSISDLHPGVEIVPGDMGKPQNELEALVEADRQFAAKVNDENVEASSDKMLNAEMLFTESLAEKSMDRDRFKAVFINTVQSECAGLTLEQIEDSIRRDHEMLFDKRTGIQAKLAYRAELLKDATAEERAKRLKDDWLFKPNKKVDDGEKKKSKAAKAPFDPAAAIRSTLQAKGLTEEQIKAKMAKLGLA